MRLLSILAAILFTVISFPVIAEEAADNTFTMNTNAFLNGHMLPVLYTCDGKNVSPQLDWKKAPDKTQFFALIVTDHDAPGGTFYHWVLLNLPKSTKDLKEGTKKLPAGVVVGKNSFGKTEYNGPCPPYDTTHTYYFTLYALDKKLDLAKDSDGKKAIEEINKHTLGKAELSAVYSRWFNTNTS